MYERKRCRYQQYMVWWLMMIMTIAVQQGSSTLQARPVGDTGDAMAPPDMCKSVNPISTWRDRLCLPYYYWFPQILSLSDTPVSLGTNHGGYDEDHHQKSTFGRSVNPISTRGDRLCPPSYYWHPRIFRPSDGPANHGGDDEDHHQKSTPIPALQNGCCCGNLVCL